MLVSYNKNFYPTPKALIDRMLNGLDVTMINSILEPSAGKGDIADAIKEKYKCNYYRSGYSECDIDCIEIDPDLQATLKGKDYRVIYNDFLSFRTSKHYDLIIMNPPFDNGDKHLLKAIRLQEHGGGIVCLLNAETIRNPYTNTRKELKTLLDKYEASIEFIENAFVNSERSTAVEVALIKINIPKEEKESFIFDNLKKAKTYEPLYDTEDTMLTRFTEENDFVELIVEQYETEVKAGIEFIREYERMKPYILRYIPVEGEEQYGNEPIIQLRIGSKYANNNPDPTANNYLREVRYKYWYALFHNPKFVGRLTSNLQSELHSKIDELKDYDFSVYNIMKIQQQMIENTVKGIEETILNLFDEFSRKFSWLGTSSENIHYYNGWATNKAWKINKKIILPINGFSSWRYGGKETHEFRPRYIEGKFADIIKVFDYLDGGRTPDIKTLWKLEAAEKSGITSGIELKYMKVTFYKKGTCHIEFTDLDLLAKFNLYGSQRRGWLPPAYGKKRYKDMTEKEKEIVKEFSGSEAEYNKIYERQSFYLVESNDLLMIGGA